MNFINLHKYIIISFCEGVGGRCFSISYDVGEIRHCAIWGVGSRVKPPNLLDLQDSLSRLHGWGILCLFLLVWNLQTSCVRVRTPGKENGGKTGLSISPNSGWLVGRINGFIPPRLRTHLADRGLMIASSGIDWRRNLWPLTILLHDFGEYNLIEEIGSINGCNRNIISKNDGTSQNSMRDTCDKYGTTNHHWTSWIFVLLLCWRSFHCNIKNSHTPKHVCFYSCRFGHFPQSLEESAFCLARLFSYAQSRFPIKRWHYSKVFTITFINCCSCRFLTVLSRCL